MWRNAPAVTADLLGTWRGACTSGRSCLRWLHNATTNTQQASTVAKWIHGVLLASGRRHLCNAHFSASPSVVRGEGRVEQAAAGSFTPAQHLSPPSPFGLRNDAIRPTWDSMRTRRITDSTLTQRVMSTVTHPPLPSRARHASLTSLLPHR